MTAAPGAGATGPGAKEPAPGGGPAGGPGAARVARNALLKVAVQATRLLSMAFLILAARLLGPEAFGKFVFAYTLAGLLGAVLDLGMHAVLVRDVARAPGATPAHWAAALTLKLALLGPAGVAYVAVPLLTGRPPDTVAAVWLVGAALVFQSFIELAVSVFTGFGRLELELELRLVEKVALVAVGLTGLWLGGGLAAVAGAFAAAAALSLGLGVALVRRRLAPVRWRLAPEGARALARTLGPVAVAFVLGIATTRLVPLAVALLAGDVAAGHFGAAGRVLDVVVVVPTALVAAVYPVLARTPPGSPAFRAATRRTVEVLLLAGWPVTLALALEGQWVATAVFGAAYAPAGDVFRLMAPVVGLAFVAQFLGVVFLALDRPGRLVVLGLVSLAASAAVGPPLAWARGAAGGAVALGVVHAVIVAGAVLGLRPLVGVPVGPGALRGLLAAGVAAGVALLVPAGGPGRLAAALAAYAAAVAVLRPLPGVAWGTLLRDVVRPGRAA
jgi:O-antigen/teichoic acid export membrane protein